MEGLLLLPLAYVLYCRVPPGSILSPMLLMLGEVIRRYELQGHLQGRVSQLYFNIPSDGNGLDTSNLCLEGVMVNKLKRNPPDKVEVLVLRKADCSYPHPKGSCLQLG